MYGQDQIDLLSCTPAHSMLGQAGTSDWSQFMKKEAGDHSGCWIGTNDVCPASCMEVKNSTVGDQQTRQEHWV